MAIRIPMRSSAAESVGGKTIRIPRDKGKQAVNLPSTNTLGIAANNPISSAMNKVTGFLDTMAARKAENDRRIEEQRIRDKNTTNKSLLNKSGDEFIQFTVKDNKDILTDDGYRLKFKEWEKKSEKWIKDTYKDDPDALARFNSDKITVYTTIWKNMETERNIKVLANGRIVFDTQTQNLFQEIDKMQVDYFVWEKFKLKMREEKNRWSSGETTGYVDKNKWDEHYKAARSAMWIKVLSAGKLWTNPSTGRTEPDFIAIYDELLAAKSTKTWYGERLIKKEEDELLPYFKIQADNQSAMKKHYDDRVDDIEIDKFHSRLLKLESGDSDEGKNFLQDLEASPIQNKEPIRNYYMRVINNLNSGIDSWNNPQGKATEALLASMVLSGFIDTKKERLVISNLIGEGVIQPRIGIALYNESIKQSDKKNKWKQTVYNDAVRLILKEVGAGSDLVDLFTDPNFSTKSDQEQIATIIGFIKSDKMNYLAYEAINNLNEILKDYEQKEGKGFTQFSYYDALVDKTSKNYVIKNLIDMFKDAEISRQQKNLELNVESIIDYYKSGAVGWRLDPSLWMSNEARDLKKFTVNMPVREKDETVFEYIRRLNKWNLKNLQEGNQLPAVLTSEWTDATDLSNIFIVPEKLE